MKMAFMDLETYSTVPIRSGTWAYAEGAEVLLWAYALDDGPIKVWDLTTGEAMPTDLATMLADDSVVTCWHNGGMFDSVVLKVAMGIDLPLHRVHDTLVQALAHSLPGSLGDLCTILKVPTDKAKDKAGKDLIRLFCSPPGKHLKRGRATRETHPTEWARFVEYASLDIAAMREVYRKMPKWNLTETEVALWHLDQRVNRRGMCVDVELARAAVRAVDAAQIELKARTIALTNGEVESTTKRDAMLEHVLAEYGVDLPDMQKSTIERRMGDPDLPAGLRELLRIRLQASSTSTTKYKALLNSVSSDGRLRGTKQFCGAGRTGRWAGRLFQPDNLPRPVLDQDDIDLGIEALKAGCADLLYDNVMELISSAIRGCIVAPPGRKLVVADLSNIEGRVLAWLAGETWKLKAFADYDAGTGHDLYKLAYAKSFGVAPDSVDKGQRQIGKVQELALGYAGGVGAFLTFAAAYGIDLEVLADQAFRAIPQHVMAQANIMFEWHRDKKKKDPATASGLSKKAWLVCESFKLAWREAHPATVSLWRDLENAVRDAIENPGTTFPCRALRVRRDGAWLRIRLPSGRALCYPSPEISRGGECVSCEGTGKVLAGGCQGEAPPGVAHWEICDACKGKGKSADSNTISYMGMNQYSRKWERVRTYSGKLVENCIQAIARDVMAANMPAIEDAGYQIILTVHDECICEADDDLDHDAKGLSEILATVPDWAEGLPLAAAGFEAPRYKKD